MPYIKKVGLPDENWLQWSKYWYMVYDDDGNKLSLNLDKSPSFLTYIEAKGVYKRYLNKRAGATKWDSFHLCWIRGI